MNHPPARPFQQPCAHGADDRAPPIAPARPWRADLNRNQNVVGKLMAVCRRHVEVVGGLSERGWSALRTRLPRRMKALTGAVAPGHVTFMCP